MGHPVASFIEVSIKMNEEALVACVLKSTSSTTLDAEGGLDVGSDTGCWKHLSSHISSVDVNGRFSLVIIDMIILF